MAVVDKIPAHVERFPGGGLVITSVDWALNWGRKSSLWYMLFGLACCAIEMMATGASRFDFDRFGIFHRPSPRQADLMIVAGTVVEKMGVRVRRLYDQMAEPRYVLAMGACAICGGPYKDAYSVVQGVDMIIPVDVHVPGCPPRPEALLHGIIMLQEKISGEKLSEKARKNIEIEINRQLAGNNENQPGACNI